MEKTCVQSADIESTACHSRIINSLTAASPSPSVPSPLPENILADKSKTIGALSSNSRSPQMSSKDLQLQLQTKHNNKLSDKKIYKSYENLTEDGEGRGCSISMSTPAAENMALFKDEDDSRSGSSDDITTPIVDLQRHNRNSKNDDDKTVVAPPSSTNVVQVIQDHNRRLCQDTTMTASTGGVGVVGIYLETPVIDEQIVSVNSHDYEKAKPKRLSDEFLMSSEDCCDDERNNSTSSTNSSNDSNPLAIHRNISISKTAECLSSNNSSNISGILKKEGILNDLLKSVMNADGIIDDDDDAGNSKSGRSTVGIGVGGGLCDFYGESQYEGGNVDNMDAHPAASGSMALRFKNISIDYHPFGNKVKNEINDVGVGVEVGIGADVADNDVQSMDAIERRDFEDEQRLTGGIILKSSSLAKNDRLKLELVQLNAQNANNQQQRVVSSDSKCTYKDHSTTPTSSRHYKSRLTKSTAKINLTTSLNHPESTVTNGEEESQEQNPTESKDQSESCNNSSTTNDNYHHKVQHQHDPESCNPGPESASSAGTDSSSSPLNLRTTLHDNPAKKLVEILSNPNSNESLSEHSFNTSSSHSLSRASKQTQPIVCLSSEEEILKKAIETINTLQQKLGGECINEDDIATTSSSARCQYSALKYLRNSLRKDNTSNLQCDDLATVSVSGSGNAAVEDKLVPAASPLFAINSNSHSNFQQEESNQQLNHEGRRVTEFPYLDHALPLDNEFDEETWADCDEGSDDEVCTCHKDSFSNQREKRDTSDLLSEDALSKDVELSSYIQMVSISEDTLSHEHSMSPEFTGLQRKRKFNESRLLDADHFLSDSGRKRIAYDYSSTPRSSQTLMLIPSPSTPLGRRTPRSLIPTRDNPPPELQDWLVQFQRWSHAERLLAVDRLIEHCEPTQVRHMMKVIEPQFQRDFISLLPRELALQVLAYLDPTDLLRAAQTCRSWRFLCDDNLLWKEKCRKAQILIEPKTDRPKRGRAGNMPPIASPWKAAYMRQHIIEMNWRSRPIREPKVLKGHDDHVITCLQFSGNRIVSGSDDNTLKVWSAVTGRCLRTLVGHTGGVWSSQMSGNIIISGSTDRTLKVWDMETGECVHTLLGHTSTVRCMHLHGKKVVSGSRDATLRVWDIERGNCLHVLVGHLAAVRCVQYDGKLIVSGAYDYMVKIWHPERQECLHTLQGHTNRVYSLQFDGIHVVSGSLDTSIRVWDVETGNCKHTLMGHQSLTSGMELRQNILVSGNADSTVKVWDITNGQCLQTLSGPNKHQSAVTCLQFNSRFVITSSDDGTVKLWDVKTGEFIRNLVALDSGGSGGVVWRIRANDTKLICAVGSRNGTEETKLMVLDFDVEGACVKCS
ncbi:F-box/WD repeat-containing protein 7 [Eupeodes corollae]|uniref:F-box/WD repeat-containing protein 7 n=1 Tax=Eupeodes corollae TaxID=290404 RepID=UPI0024925DF7|nr:F-box/WD repeat-containing protein 7 [Eupeodes corollae]